MTVLQPFLDIIASLYNGIVAVASAQGALAKAMAGLQLMNFATYLPSAITNAPQALAALENLSDTDRKSVEAYLAGKVPGLSADTTAKLIAILDLIIRIGGGVPDIIVLIKGAASTAAPSATAVISPAASTGVPAQG